MGWDRIRAGDQLSVKRDQRGALECGASRIESVRASEMLCGTRLPRGIEESLVYRMQLKKWRRPEHGLCARAGCSVARATGNGAPHFQKEQARGMQRAPTSGGLAQEICRFLVVWISPIECGHPDGGVHRK